jgi:hypothetical protein
LIGTSEKPSSTAIDFGSAQGFGHEFGRFERFSRRVADHDLSGADDYWKSGIEFESHVRQRTCRAGRRPKVRHYDP